MSTIINATTTNGVVIQPDNSGSLVLQTNSGTTALTIDTSQNVGIGTTSPSYKLDVGSFSTGTTQTIRVASSGNTQIKLMEADDSYGFTFRNTAAVGLNILRHNADSTGVSVLSISRGNGDLSFNSGYGSVAVAYGCRAWVNFNGTGTIAIRASGNVSSLTDNGVGDYTVNFTTAMPDANYAATSMTANEDTNGNRGAGGAQIFNAASVATSSLRIFTAFGATAASDGAKNDQPTICVAIFR